MMGPRGRSRLGCIDSGGDPLDGGAWPHAHRGGQIGGHLREGLVEQPGMVGDRGFDGVKRALGTQQDGESFASAPALGGAACVVYAG